METQSVYACMAGAEQFKSYYVVWKHNIKHRILSEKLTFKSYYVVWKPIAGGSSVRRCE